MPLNFERHCWLQVSLDNLTHNYNLIKQATNAPQILPVIKANAYGHGDVMVAKTLQKAGAKQFAVSCFEEALHLRNNGISAPILIMGYTSPAFAKLLHEHNFLQCVPSLSYALSLCENALACGVKIKVHFKLDTGMGRLGFGVSHSKKTALQNITEAYGLQGLQPIGALTHFASSDSANLNDIKFTNNQFALFTDAISTLAENNITFSYIHCSNSGAICKNKNMSLGAVRPGIILYGCPPSDDVTLKGLRPIGELKTVVTMVKNLSAGESVSYGRTFTAQKNITVATLAAGYADGYPRLLSNKGVVSVNGKPAPIIGRVCMDQCVIDVSHIDGVQAGSEVALFGANGKHGADTAHEAAKKCGTISYELLCNVNQRVVRTYVENGEEISFVNYLT